MKKLLMILLLGMFMISFTSAFEFDNVKSYDEETRTVTITNALGLGDDIGGARLTTPLNNKVGAGYQKVAEFELWAYQDYNDIIKSIDMYDNNQEDWEKHKFTRDFDLKFRSYEDVEVNDHEVLCEQVYSPMNGTTSEVCENVVIGSHIETKEVWDKVTPAILKKNDIVTVGIFTEVEIGDYVEWIPSIYGVEIEEWASWTAELNVDIVSYYKLDNNNFSDSTANGNDGTNSGTTNTTGKIIDSRNFDGGIYNINLGNIANFGNTDDFTVSTWINPTSFTGNGVGIIGRWDYGSSERQWLIDIDSSGHARFRIGNGAGTETATSTVPVTTGKWYHIVVVRDAGSTIKVYVNGTETASETDNLMATQTQNLLLGMLTGGDTSYDFNGKIDEASIWERALTQTEITQLYNGGDGISYTEVVDQPPVVTLNLPSDNANFTADPTIVNFSCNASDDINLVNVSLLINGEINQTNTSGINNTQYNFQVQLPEGGYDWTCEATDNDSLTTQATNRTLFIHDTPPTLDVYYPVGNLGFNSANDVLVLNWTVTEIGQNLTTHITNCTYDYNGTITEVNNTVCTQINETTFNYAAGVNTLTFNVTDEFGFVNSKTTIWDVNLTEVSQTYPNSSVEIATETYTASVIYDNDTFSVITGTLNINGTEYLGTKTMNGNSATFTSNAIMPPINTETNFTAYWSIGLTDDSQTINYNLSSNNVTVGIINMSLCGSPLTVPFWNFTIINESNSASITSTFEATFTVSPGTSSEVNTFSFSYTAGSASEYDFCISPSDNNYTVSTAIKLTKTGFVDKFYNYQDVSLSNATREDNLYMMTSGDSTSFIVNVVYVDSTDVEGAEVQVQRYYQGTGLWETTEILTTNYIGEAVGHFLAEDANYRFLVYQDGVSVLNSSSTQITCTLSPCTVTLTIPINVPSGVEPVEDLTSTLTYSDTTNVFTYTYSDSSGDLSLARLYVVRVFPSNATLIIPCNETKTTDSGVLTCDITGQINGTYRASAYITRASDEFFDINKIGVLGNKIYNSMGNDGVLWAIFILIGVIMLGIARPSMAIIFGTIGIVVIGLIQIINIGTISIIAIVVVAVILLMRVKRE